MKQILPMALFASLLLAATAKATQISVNNNTGSPSVYTTLQAAISAAKAGDTILVAGSPTDYAAAGEITINKKLMLLGTGYAPFKDNPVIANISRIHLQAGSAGTAIFGFNLGYTYSDPSAGINNVIVKRNSIWGGLNTFGDNWIIQENIIASTVNVNGNNIIVKNNVFSNNGYANISNSVGNTNLIFSNNVVFWCQFFNGTPVFYNALVVNNIFYNGDGKDINYFATSNNITASNNIVYNNPDANPLNIGVNGNTGSGNNFNSDPKFTALQIITENNTLDAFGWGSNLALLPTSPGHNAGTDGRDIGIYGGSGAQNPLTGVPPIPMVTTMNVLTATVAPGGPINTAIKAKSNN